MNNTSLLDMTWDEYKKELKRKSKNIINPLVANLELTPRCNFNCKMCYVHLTEKEMKTIGNLHTASEWINIGKEMAEAGTLEVLLTGGEVFTRPDFRDIYDEYCEMGFLLHIYSNGYLIDEKAIEWLAQKPPLKLRISLYGASNETYERVTGVKGAFDRVINNIDMITKANLPLSLCATIIQDNFDDQDAIIEIASARGLHLIKTTGVMKPVRGAKSDAEDSRINAGKSMLENPESEKIIGLYEVSPNPFEYCGSNQCGFWITWDGKMTICSFLEKPCAYPFDSEFISAWNELQLKLKDVKKPAQCNGCIYAPFCKACPGAFNSETGFPDQTNEYLCNIAKSRYQIFHDNAKKVTKI